MGKGILSIWILIVVFFFSDEAQARVPTGEFKTKIDVQQHNHDLFCVITSANRFDLEQSSIRVVPASRCGQVQKYVGNSYWTVLSFSATTFSNHELGARTHLVAESSYLSHIYPSHNFW